ncbi:MAG: PAS domain S-box protein [Methanomassiliicoccales archaeon]
MFGTANETLRVLCIDDEATFLELTKEFLQEGGHYRVSTAFSAEEGLRLWQESEFDAIVCDYDMPGMDGLRLLQIVRDTPSPIPFIIFTGRGREEVAIAALNAGADFYLQKGGQARAQFAELCNKIDQAVRRRRAEEALVRSEEMFRGMAERSSDVTILVDTDLRPVYISSSVERLSGFKPEELVGRPPEELGMHLEDLARIRAAVIAGPTPFSEELLIRLKKKDGGLLYLEIRATPIIEGGHFAGVQIEGRDVTDKKQLMDTLSINTERFRQAERVGRTGCWEATPDVENPMLWGSEGTLRIFGLSLDVSERPFAEIISCITEPDVLQEALASLLLEDLDFDVTFDIQPADGALRRTVHAVAELQRDAAGTPLRVVGVVRDVTEKVALDHQLKESDKHYHLLAENILDVVWLLDFETGRFLYVSPSVESLRGFTAAEVMAEPMEASLTEASLEIIGEKVGDAFDEFVTGNGRPSHFTVELEQPCKDGSTVMTEVVTSFHRNQESGRTEVIGISRNITKRRRAQDALREANRRLSILNSITRHDLLDQLTVLQSHLEHDKRAAAPDMRARLDKISTLARHMERQLVLTRDYQEMGSAAPEWQSVANALVRAVGQLDMGAIVLDEELGEIEILADPLLERVFLNLLNNSLRRGGNVTMVRLGKYLEGDDLLLVYEDDGLGVAATQKLSIFDSGPGGDMGLFLAKEVLSMTRIGLEENGVPGKGVRFEMRVPSGRFRNEMV